MTALEHIRDGARTAGQGIARLGIAAGGVVEDVVETIGNGLADAAGAVAPGGGVLRWAGASLAEAIGLIGAAASAVLAAATGALGGSIRALGGVAALDRRAALAGAGDVAAGLLGGATLVLGKLLATVQVTILAQNPRRRLTPKETGTLAPVFRDALALYNVRVVEGRAGLYDVNARAFVLGNTIYLKSVDPARRPDILVHEACHAWQYQQLGPRYITDALYAQVRLPDAYDWRAEKRAGRAFAGFNLEAQAQLLQETYTAAGDALGDAALAHIRARRSPRPSRRLTR